MKDALLAVKCVRLHAMKANDSRLSCALKRCNDVLPEHQAAGCQEPSALQRRRRSSANCRSIILNMMGGGGAVFRLPSKQSAVVRSQALQQRRREPAKNG